MAQKEQPPRALTPCPLEPPQVTPVPTLALRPCTEVGRLLKDLLTEMSPLALAITFQELAASFSPPCQLWCTSPASLLLVCSLLNPTGPKLPSFCSKKPTQSAWKFSHLPQGMGQPGLKFPTSSHPTHLLPSCTIHPLRFPVMHQVSPSWVKWSFASSVQSRNHHLTATENLRWDWSPRPLNPLHLGNTPASPAPPGCRYFNTSTHIPLSPPSPLLRAPFSCILLPCKALLILL